MTDRFWCTEKIDQNTFNSNNCHIIRAFFKIIAEIVDLTWGVNFYEAFKMVNFWTHALFWTVFQTRRSIRTDFLNVSRFSGTEPISFTIMTIWWILHAKHNTNRTKLALKHALLKLILNILITSIADSMWIRPETMYRYFIWDSHIVCQTMFGHMYALNQIFRGLRKFRTIFDKKFRMKWSSTLGDSRMMYDQDVTVTLTMSQWQSHCHPRNWRILFERFFIQRFFLRPLFAQMYNS